MDPGGVFLGEAQVQRRLEELVISHQELCRRADISTRTLQRKLNRGERCRHRTAELVAAALKCDVADIVRRSGVDTPTDTASEPPGWLIGQPLTAFRELPNGVHYRIFHARHRSIRGREGRAKLYDLLHVDDETVSSLHEALQRHANTAQRVESEPHFPVCYETYRSPGMNLWWVIDAWVEGQTLAELLKTGPLASRQLRDVMIQVAEGLQTLHAVDVIRRDLTPESILISASDGAVVLTDFELARLLDGSPSVNGQGLVSPYAAPEIDAPSIDATVDLYSWGQLFLHCLTGQCPDNPSDPSVLDDYRLPRRIRNAVRMCLAVSYHERPQSFGELLKTLHGWK